jgi:hypothetical protein
MLNKIFWDFSFEETDKLATKKCFELDLLPSSLNASVLDGVVSP